MDMCSLAPLPDGERRFVSISRRSRHEFRVRAGTGWSCKLCDRGTIMNSKRQVHEHECGTHHSARYSAYRNFWDGVWEARNTCSCTTPTAAATSESDELQLQRRRAAKCARALMTAADACCGASLDKRSALDTTIVNLLIEAAEVRQSDQTSMNMLV